MDEAEAGPGSQDPDSPNKIGTQNGSSPQHVGSVPQGPEIAPLKNPEDHAAASLPPLPAEETNFVEEGQTLVATAGSGDALHDQIDSSEDHISSAKEESEDDEALLLPGPIDPVHCSASGPGFSGAAAGIPVTLVLVSKDSTGRRLKEGGAYVLVYVEATGPGAAADDADPLEAEVVDHQDGTYSAIYTVPSKGSYELSIEVNGQPIGGSPFPVFFSAAGRDATTGGGEAGVSALDGAAAASAPAAVPAVLSAEASAMAAVASMSTMPNLSSIGLQFSLGPQAAQLGVTFPPVDDSQLSRTSLVGGVSPFATQEALRSVFALSCRVRSIQFAGPSRTFAFIEFDTKADADASSRLTGVTFMGQALRVENALHAREAAQGVGAAGAGGGVGVGSGHPFLAMQAQQVQAYEMMQHQQAALAQHVAHLRASGMRNGDEYAAAAMARKFGSSNPHHSHIPAGDVAHYNNGMRNGDGSRRRGRERSHRSRSRTRSRSRDCRRRSRSKSRERRHKSEKRGHYDKRSRSRSRSRSTHRRKDRRRSRSRSRSRSKGSRKHRHRSRSKERRYRDEKSRRDGAGTREEKRREETFARAVVVDEHKIVDKRKVVVPPVSPADDLEALLDELDA